MKAAPLFLILLSFGFSESSAQSHILTNGIVVGGVTESSARFWVRLNGPDLVNIELAADSSFASRTGVSLIVYNALGQIVSTLVDEVQEAGLHSVKFDGSRLASGMYVCRIHATDFVQSRKLLLVSNSPAVCLRSDSLAVDLRSDPSRLTSEASPRGWPQEIQRRFVELHRRWHPSVYADTTYSQN